MLAGLQVLDFSSVGPAARCARILADYGARVIKIGAPPGRSGVQIEPAFHAYAGHRGMQRVRIDLKAPAGRRAFLQLAEKADVVIESFRPGVVQRLGIAYADVQRVNRRIVYCSTSGYGQQGPYARWAGHDLNYLAVAGFLGCSQQRADGAPAIPGATVADSAAGGMHAALAILAALLRRSTTGEGAFLDVSVAEGVLQLMSLHVDEYLATGHEPGPDRSLLTGRYACYDLYRARDGKWLTVAAIEPHFFANLCRALDLERWIPHQLEDARQDEIRADLAAAFARRDRDVWVAELGPGDACVAPVYAVSELVEDAHFLARGAFVAARHERHGSFRQVGHVLAGSDRSQSEAALRDASVTDTDGLLRDAGLPPATIEELRSQGVIA